MKLTGFILAFAAVTSLAARPASAQHSVNATFHVSVTVDSTLQKMKLHSWKEHTLALQLVHHSAITTMATKTCPECSVNPAGCKCDTTWSFQGLSAQMYSARVVMGDSTFVATGGKSGAYSVITYFSARPTVAGSRWNAVNVGHATWVSVNPSNPQVEFNMRIPSWGPLTH